MARGLLIKPVGESTDAMMQRRVLVVEDDDSIRAIVAEALREDGYHVYTARNGAEALAHVRRDQQHLDLVFLDLMMPVMDGWAFLREWRNLPWCKDVPVVVLSAAYVLQKAGEEFAGHVHATLAKPFDLGVLLAIAGRVTGHHDPA